jgi:hypothetical protein
MEKEIGAAVITTLIGGGIGYLFSRKGKDEDKLEERVTALEHKVADLAVGQRDVVHIKETQDRLLNDLQEVVRILSDIRIELAIRKGEKDGG